MARRPKTHLMTFVLAFVAVLAGSVTVAPAASAQGMLTSDGPVTLDGQEESPPALNVLTLFKTTVICPGSTYDGEKVGGGLLPSGSTTTTVTPNYVNCKTAHVLPTTVTMNGCDYVLHMGGTKETNLYNLTADLVCPGSNEVTVDIYLSHEAHTKELGNPFCRIYIKPRSNLAGGTLRDETNGHLTLGGTVEGIHVLRTGACESEVEPNTENNATLHLAVTISGTNAAGEPTGIGLSHNG